MPLDVAAVQQSLKAEGLDGWLLYDFHGSNPIAARLVGTANGAKMTTRRWFYLVPASGEPRGPGARDRAQDARCPAGRENRICGRQQLDAGLTKLLSGVKRVAMEYSRECAIPYISRIDAGTRRTRPQPRHRRGIVRRSRAAFRSGMGRRRRSPLIARRRGALSRQGSRVRAHTEARARRRGDDGIRGSAADGGVVRGRRADERLAPGRGGAGETRAIRTICRRRGRDAADTGKDELVLLDLWGKEEGRPAGGLRRYYLGRVHRASTSRPEMARAFEAIARRAMRRPHWCRSQPANSGDLRGWQVDRAARSGARAGGVWGTDSASYRP